MDNNTVNETIDREETNINLAEIFHKMLSKWHWFAIAIVVALLAAFIITKYSVPQYEATATLLIKDNDGLMDQMSMLSNVISNRNQVNFKNEVGILQSLSMVKRTIKALDFYSTYYCRENMRYVDIYKDSPFEVVLDLYQSQPTGVMVKVNLTNKNGCVVSYGSKNNVPVYDYAEDRLLEKTTSVEKREVALKYGEWYSKDGMKFKVQLKDPSKWNENYSKIDYAFTINDLDAVAKEFNATEVELINKESSIVTIKYKHQNKHKAEDFVNMLCKIYIDATFEEKNYLNISTIEFVNSQIAAISDSLSIAEKRREVFQQNNNTLNLTNDAAYLYERGNELEVQRAEAYTRRSYYNALEEYINKANLEDGMVVPSTMGIEDPVLNLLVETLTKLVLEKQKLSATLTPKSPKMKELSLQIETTRQQIQENLRTIKKQSDITDRELKRQRNLLQAEIDKLPSTQRNMINLERQFKFNDEIYTFLYQKRAEAEIAKNAALPDHKVIDSAKYAIKVYPKTAINFLIALLVGLLIPGGYIFIRYMLNNTIEGKEDLDKISSNSILGYIPEFPSDYNRMVVFDRPKSQITESFRSLRTNIKYILQDDNAAEGRIIMTTSSLPHEGKTLTSLNLASVLSLNGARTLLAGYDLRKPKLAKIFNINPHVGISTYLIGKSTLDEVIQRTEFDNFDVLCSGPVPPNPSELVDSEKNRELLKELRKRYDYIVLDTPPVSLIADAQALAKEADINLFIVRSGRTDKSVMKIALSELEERSGVKVYFVLNGIQNAMQKYGYGYGKGYAYGYGYGYGKGYGYGGYGYGYFEDAPSNGKTKKKHRRG